MASEPIRDEPKQGAGSSDNNLGGLIVLVLLFFAIFFYLGFNEAKKQQRQPGAIARFVIFHTRLVHIGDTNHLVYGDAEWMLDLKTNKVKLGDPVRQQLAMLESRKAKIIGVDSSLLQAILGGAPAALTLNDLGALAKKGGDYRRIIAQIVGAGTGLYAGSWVANRFFPLKYDDPAIMNWLNSSRDHSEIKKLFLSRRFFDNRKEIAKKSAQQIIDSALAEKLRAYELVENSLGNPEYVPTNEDFSVFAEVR